MRDMNLEDFLNWWVLAKLEEIAREMDLPILDDRVVERFEREYLDIPEVEH